VTLALLIVKMCIMLN